MPSSQATGLSWSGRSPAAIPASGPLPAGSGQQVDVRVATVLELTDNGLIRRDSEYWDFATVLTQLGVIAQAEPAATPAP